MPACVAPNCRRTTIKKSKCFKRESLHNSGCGTKPVFFWHRVEICDKVLLKHQRYDGMHHADGAYCCKRRENPHYNRFLCLFKDMGQYILKKEKLCPFCRMFPDLPINEDYRCVCAWESGSCRVCMIERVKSFYCWMMTPASETWRKAAVRRISACCLERKLQVLQHWGCLVSSFLMTGECWVCVDFI